MKKIPFKSIDKILLLQKYMSKVVNYINFKL